MRIAIPQYQGTVSGAYELSQAISVHDLDFQKLSITDAEMLVFPKVQASFELLVEKKVQAILVGTIDPDNADILSEKGIHVFTGAGDLSPAETVVHFMNLMSEAMQRRAQAHTQGGGCCGGGESDGGCCGGEKAEDDHECCGGKGHEDGGECCGGKGHGEAEGESHECCGKHEH